MNDGLPLSPSPHRPLSSHVIRLREPWQHMPIPGGTRHTRSFNWLAELLPGQRVWLVIDAASVRSVTVNGFPVGQASSLPGTSRLPDGTGTVCPPEPLNSSGRQDACPTGRDITSVLASRNELVIEQAGEDVSLGEVRLEIDDPPVAGADGHLQQSVADADADRTRPMREVAQSLGKTQA